MRGRDERCNNNNNDYDHYCILLLLLMSRQFNESLYSVTSARIIDTRVVQWRNNGLPPPPPEIVTCLATNCILTQIYHIEIVYRYAVFLTYSRVRTESRA